MIWTLETSWKRPPLSLNDRGRWQTFTARKKAIRDEIITLVRQANIPRQAHISARMIWTVPTRHDRDEDNTMATMKVVWDALIDPRPKRPGAGIVPEDTPQYMTKPMTEIRYEKGVSKVDIEIEGTG